MICQHESHISTILGKKTLPFLWKGEIFGPCQIFNHPVKLRFLTSARRCTFQDFTKSWRGVNLSATGGPIQQWLNLYFSENWTWTTEMLKLNAILIPRPSMKSFYQESKHSTHVNTEPARLVWPSTSTSSCAGSSITRGNSRTILDANGAVYSLGWQLFENLLALLAAELFLGHIFG